MRKFTILAAVLILAASAMTIVAGPMGREGRGIRGAHGGEHGLLRMADELELSEDQISRIEEIRSTHRLSGEAVRERMAAARSALDDAIHAAELDEASIRDASAALARLQADVAVERATGFHEIRAILTPEQQARAEELRIQRRAFMAERRGFGGRHHGHRPGHGGDL